MIPNKLRTAWEDGKQTINGWLSIASPFGAEIMAAQGFDSLTVDLQHGVVDYADAVTMFQAMRASGVMPMARVPTLDAGAVMKVLDAGAYGVICPMINTRAQAEQLVSCVRYPPRGLRSFGPTRANFTTGGGYAKEANDAIVCLAMIETAEAMANLREIVSTPDLDGIYIGPADLTLGVANGRLAPGLDREEPEMIDAIKRILSEAKGAGIRAGLHCDTPGYAAKAFGWGFDFTTLSNDVRFLSGAASAAVNEARRLIGQDSEAGEPDGGGY
ncbi:MAG: HpcH/HpaI aldolase/citrate lyase family protein [Paracoccaceae bacterium]